MRLAAILPLFLLVLAAASSSTAQPAPAPAQPSSPQPDALVVIHAGTLLDRPGRPPRRNATITVRAGTPIRAAGPSDSLPYRRVGTLMAI